MSKKMIREIPEEILERTGKEVFQGNNYKDGKAFQIQHHSDCR